MTTITTDGWYLCDDGAWRYYRWERRCGVSAPVCKKVWPVKPAHYYVDNGRVQVTDAAGNPTV